MSQVFEPPVPPFTPEDEAGHAHVATASFLGARLAPSGGFAVALAGGLAIARVSGRSGWRTGVGASIAAMLQTVAIMGPLRFTIPFTQAVSAPIIGVQHVRGVAVWAQIALVVAIRFVLQVAAVGFYIFVILGGVEPYADAHNALAGRLPFVPSGQSAALGIAAVSLLGWTIAGSVIQVLVYRRGLNDWPKDGDPLPEAPPTPDTETPAWLGSGSHAKGPRFDPRAVALSAAVAFAVLIASHGWIVLGAVTAWLVAAWLPARADRGPVRPGLILAGILAGGVLFVGLIGGTGLELTGQRTLRALLLVLVATWLRAAAGEEGLREVAHRSLHRLRWLPAVPEASRLLDRLGQARALFHSGRSLMAAVKDVRDVGPLAVAVLGWIAAETRHYTSPPLAPRVRLVSRIPDRLLVFAALAAAAAVAVPAA